MPTEERKYCLGDCGTILNGPCVSPNKKYCDSCRAARITVACNKSQDKYRQKYNENRRKKRNEVKIVA